jgi:hypothetical protein
MCEKCWSDAGVMAHSGARSKTEIYNELMDERRNHPCTPAQQCGEPHRLFNWKDGTRHCVCGINTSKGEGEDD